MFKKKISKIMSLIMVLCILLPTAAVAAPGDPQTVQYIYFQDSSSEMVAVDYTQAINDAILGNLTLYNGIKQNLGTAILNGAPVYLETTIGTVLDYQMAITNNKPDLVQFQDDPTYQTARPDCTKKLTVVGGVATIVPIVAPAAPAVTNNDTANTVSGMMVGYEYSLDGAFYVLYDAATFAAIDFSGNHSLLVRVAAAGLNPAGAVKTLTFTTNVVTPPVTNNDVLDTVSGMMTTMEYSYDGASYVPYDPFDIAFASLDLHGDHLLLVRYAATGGNPASEPTTLIFTTRPGPLVTNDDTTNTVSGMDDTMEYSLDGLNYMPYDAIVFGALDFSGDKTLLVRYFADSFLGYPPSLDTVLTFTMNPGPNVTNDDIANTVSGMIAGYEYNLDDAGYMAYNTITFDAIDFSGDHILLVRVASDGINPPGPAATLIFTTNPIAPDPPAVTNNDVTNTVSGMTSTMEYSYDGASYVPYDPFDLAFASLNFHGDHTLLVRYAAVGGTPASLVTTLIFTTNPPRPGPLVTNNDDTNTVTGMTIEMEYNYDGTGYVLYDNWDTTAWESLDFNGNHTLLVRYAEDFMNMWPPSLDTTLIFTTNVVTPAAPDVTNDDMLNTVSGMTPGMEYSLNGAPYAAYNPVTFAAINFAGNHTLLVRIAAEGINPYGPDTTLTFTASAIDMAEAAVVAYEAAPVATSVQITTAEALKAPAVTAVALVADPTAQAAFEARIAAKDTLITTAKLNLQGSEAAVQAAAETAVAALEAAPLANIANINTATGLKTTADSKVLLVGDPVANAAFQQRITTKFIAMAIAELSLQTYAPSYDTYMAKYVSVLGIDFTQYNTLANKRPVQDAMVAATFTSISNIQMTFNAAVAAQIALESGYLAAFNSAADATAVGTAITTYATQLGLTLTEYNAFAAAGKSAVQTELLGRNFMSGQQIRTAFLIAVINNSTTAQMNTLLTSSTTNTNAVFLGLAFVGGEYSTSVKSAVHAGFIAQRPITDKTDLIVTAISYNGLSGYLDQMLKYFKDIIGLNLTDYDSLTRRNQLTIQGEIVAATMTTVAEVQNVIDTAVTAKQANEASALALFNNATTPEDIASALSAAITTYLVMYDSSDYTGLGNKLLIHNNMLSQTFTSVTHIDSVFSAYVATQKALEATATTTFNNAANAVAVETALSTHSATLGLNMAAYTALPAADMLALQNALLNAPYFANGLAVKTAFDNAIATQMAVIAINTAEGASMGTLITMYASALGLNLTDYNSLSASGRDYVHNELVGKAFADKAAVKIAFDKAVALPLFNEITTETAMGTAITSYATAVGLTLTTYNTLSSYKTAVQTALLTPVFMTTADIITAFDMAVTAEKVNMGVSSINSASTTSVVNMYINSYAVYLGLDLTDYNALTNKVPVQSAMMTPTFTTAAEVKAAFDTAVAVEKLTEAPASAIGAILTTSTSLLSLDLTDYNTLIYKEPVHAAMAAPTFTDAPSVKAVFDAAVSAEKAAEEPLLTAPSVRLSKLSTTMFFGNTETLVATVLPADAPDKTVTWMSSDPSVATVDQNGLVTAVDGGTTVISVTAPGVTETDTCVVTVIIPVSGVTLNRTVTAVYVGTTDTLVAAIQPANATNSGIIWTTSGAAYATVNNGVVTGVALNVVTITATTADGSFKATCQVTITTPAAVLNNMNLAPSYYIADFILRYANVLGYDTTDYQALPAAGKTAVQNAVMAASFTTLEEIKPLFENAVAAQLGG